MAPRDEGREWNGGEESGCGVSGERARGVRKERREGLGETRIGSAVTHVELQWLNDSGA